MSKKICTINVHPHATSYPFLHFLCLTNLVLLCLIKFKSYKMYFNYQLYCRSYNIYLGREMKIKPYLYVTFPRKSTVLYDAFTFLQLFSTNSNILIDMWNDLWIMQRYFDFRTIDVVIYSIKK